MRAFVGVCSLFLVFTYGQAQTQTILPEPRKQMRSETEEGMRAEWFKACSNDWDDATHMTRKEWDIVCRRVTDERVKFRMEQRNNLHSALS
jgi:hypothetical protein